MGNSNYSSASCNVIENLLVNFNAKSIQKLVFFLFKTSLYIVLILFVWKWQLVMLCLHYYSCLCSHFQLNSTIFREVFQFKRVSALVGDLGIISLLLFVYSSIYFWDCHPYIYVYWVGQALLKWERVKSVRDKIEIVSKCAIICNSYIYNNHANIIIFYTING